MTEKQELTLLMILETISDSLEGINKELQEGSIRVGGVIETV